MSILDPLFSSIEINMFFGGDCKLLKTPVLTQNDRQSTFFIPYVAGGGSKVSNKLRKKDRSTKYDDYADRP